MIYTLNRVESDGKTRTMIAQDDYRQDLIDAAPESGNLDLFRDGFGVIKIRQDGGEWEYV